MKVLKVYLLIFLCLRSLFSFAQQLTPPIQNYSTVDYDAASQNWDVGIGDRGIIYFANNQGLLSYDGQRWDLYPLQTGSIIRSVYPYKNRVYIGSYREFGYWSRDKKGKMFYTSLIPLLKKNDMGSEEFWEILSYKGAIYFRSFGTIYRYDGNEVEKVLEKVTNKMTVFKDRLLVAIGQDGLFFLNHDGSLDPLPNQEILKGKTIVDVLARDNSLLIGSRRALYEFDGDKVFLYPDAKLNEELRESEFNHIMQLSEDQIVIGTQKNGIISYHPGNGDYTFYNRNSGLQNNSILGMTQRGGKIWLGLDNGIDEVHLDSPIRFYLDETGELGAVYDVANYRGNLYLASNTGVYKLDNKGLSLIDGAQGHTWNLEELDGTLYSNHNTGTFKVVNGAFVPVESRTGSFQIIRNPLRPHDYFIGTYTGISEYNSVNNELERLPNINFPVKKIVFENASTIWAAHPYEGVYRISLPKNSEDTAQVRKLPNIEGKGNFKVGIFRLNNQIALLNKNRWYRYNAFKDTLEIFPELNSYVDHKLLNEDEGKFWFTNVKDNSLVYTDFKKEKVTISFQELNKRLVKGHENIIKLNDSIFYVTLNDGFAEVNLHKLLDSKKEEVISKPIILGVSDIEKNYDLSTTPSIPYKNSNNISIRAALPDSDASVLRYKLTGDDQQTGEVKNGILRFQNLKHGDYELKLFSVSPQNARSEMVSYDFEVQPPWYLSTFMKLVYLLLFLSIIALVYWFNRFKLNKHQWLLEQKFEKEHQERLNKLEKQRLMNEITLKRKELANSTMMAAKKNEVLMEIQGELNKDKDKFSNQFRVKHIMNKINNAIKNKDEWKVFETNFNELHEDFFKDLLAKYPKLSSKDLKLCSYLKMNLTSKEIAPLMGISVRGVEVHRYRLRKKMDLDKKENLTNFLIKNF